MTRNYQVGGSLAPQTPSYVSRQADIQLAHALQQGEICYVFNCRQMGKSSLLVKTKHRLQQQGFRCSVVDLSIIGSSNVTPTQWYGGILADLWMSFALPEPTSLKAWWQDKEHLSCQMRLRWFIEKRLLVELPNEKIVIFVDEIDSILSLGFPVDDFFTLIRFCYNQRSINPEYQRLTFVLFGVITPSDLIQDTQKTPFNIGRAITLEGFQLKEIEPLAIGLHKIAERPIETVKEILFWTNGQPFLTQKLCQILLEQKQIISAQQETLHIEKLVRNHLIEKWQSQDEPEHFRTIRNRIVSLEKLTGRMLELYQQILQNKLVPSDGSREQIELFLSGLVVNEQGILTIKNRIYREIFNLQWVEQQLAELRPYSQSINAWLASGQTDESRLLRGQALKDAQTWARSKSLSDLDYQYLSLSQEYDRSIVEQALEAARVKAVEAQLEEERKRLEQERHALKLQQTLFATVVIQYQKTLESERQAKISEIQALIASAQALYVSHQGLNALLQAIEASRKCQKLALKDPILKTQVTAVLRQTVYGVVEFNQLRGYQGECFSIEISPDSRQIAAAILGGPIQLWGRDGSRQATLQASGASGHKVKFSPDHQFIASTHEDGRLYLWSREGKLLQTIQAHPTSAQAIAFSPDSQIIATSGDEGTIKLWLLDGTCLKTLSGHHALIYDVVFSPDGQILASESENIIMLWRVEDGTLLKTWQAHDSGISQIAFSLDGKTLISSSNDKTIRFWNLEGSLLKTLTGHTADVSSIAVATDAIVSGSADKTLKLWTKEGTELMTLRGHLSTVRSVACSPDGSFIASAGGEQVIRLWQPSKALKKSLSAHQAAIYGVAISPDSSLIATASLDYTVKLWSREGQLINILAHEASVFRAVFSPDGRFLATGSNDNTIKIWGLEGQLLKTLHGHQAIVFDLSWSPDSRWLASASFDGTIKIWSLYAEGTVRTIAHEARVYNVVYSPDGQLIASGSSDNTLRIWHVDGTLLQSLDNQGAVVLGSAFSPDGHFFASASVNNGIALWQRTTSQTEPLQLVRNLTGHQSIITRVTFSADSQILASASSDTTIKLWKCDGTLLETLTGHTATVRELAISPDGRTLVSVGDDNTLMIWDLERILKLDLLKFATDWVDDYLKNRLIS